MNSRSPWSAGSATSIADQVEHARSAGCASDAAYAWRGSRRACCAFAALWCCCVSALAELPHAIAIVDDAENRVLLFDALTGDYLRELLPADSEHLRSPFDLERGGPLTTDRTTHENVLFITDLKRRLIAAYDANTGAFIRNVASNIPTRGLARMADGKLLLAAGDLGVRLYEPDGAFENTRIAAEPVDGPNNAWDILIRPEANGGAGDLLVSDPTLDRILRFEITGARLGVFAAHPELRFPQQLAGRQNGNVLVADPLANAVFEFSAEGAFVRRLPATRPRGVIELYSRNLLVAAEEGVLLFDGATGARLGTKLAGYPEYAPRCITALKCPLPQTLGDLNGDGALDNDDIDAFVLALSNPAAFAQRYPNVHRECAADCSRDGLVDNQDIDAFVSLLIAAHDSVRRR